MHSKLLFVFSSFYSLLLVSLYYSFPSLCYFSGLFLSSSFAIGFIFVSLERLSVHIRNVGQSSDVILRERQSNYNLVFEAVQEILLQVCVTTLFHDPEMLECLFVDQEKMKTQEGITSDCLKTQAGFLVSLQGWCCASHPVRKKIRNVTLK